MIENKYKKDLLIGLLVFILLFSIISVVYLVQQNLHKISVQNYDTYLQSVPSERRRDLEKALYQRISSFENFKKFNDDIVIRKGSYTEEYNKTYKSYSSRFIVDIDSMNQSYVVNFIWSKVDNSKIMGDDLVFSCPSGNDVKYQGFDCKKSLGIEEIIQDPIIQYLPHSGPHYKITIASSVGSKLELDINLFLDLSDKDTVQTESVINGYKTDAINWIKSNNLDINNYLINYKIN